MVGTLGRLHDGVDGQECEFQEVMETEWRCRIVVGTLGRLDGGQEMMEGEGR